MRGNNEGKRINMQYRWNFPFQLKFFKIYSRGREIQRDRHTKIPSTGLLLQLGQQSESVHGYPEVLHPLALFLFHPPDKGCPSQFTCWTAGEPNSSLCGLSYSSVSGWGPWKQGLTQDCGCTCLIQGVFSGETCNRWGKQDRKEEGVKKVRSLRWSPALASSSGTL